MKVSWSAEKWLNEKDESQLYPQPSFCLDVSLKDMTKCCLGAACDRASGMSQGSGSGRYFSEQAPHVFILSSVYTA